MISSSDKLKARHKTGDMVSVKIIENIDARSWIVSLDGTLIQVRNKSPHSFREGEIVKMRVMSLDPPQLELIS